jgi:hypothetical protein
MATWRVKVVKSDVIHIKDGQREEDLQIENRKIYLAF